MCRPRLFLHAAVLACTVAMGTASAHAAEPHVLTADTRRVIVGESLDALEDPDGTLTLDDVRSPAMSDRYVAVVGEKPNYGFSSSVYWFRFSLRNALDAAEPWILEIAYPPLDEVRLFIVRPDGTVDTRIAGDRFPFAQRESQHRNYVFSLRLEPGETYEVFARVQTESSVQLPIYIWSRQAFGDEDYRAQLALGMFYGVILVMILYNLFLFASIRDRSYLYFCACSAAYLVVQGGLDGVVYQYVWPASPSVNGHSMPIAIAVAPLFAMLFARQFLHLPRVVPRASRLIAPTVALGGALAALSIVVPYHASVRLTAAYAALSCALLMVIGVLALRAGFSAARFFVAAWALFLLGCLALVFGKFGLLPLMVATEHGPQIGFVGVVLLLSFALADRVKLSEAAKEAAQRRALRIQTRAKKTLEAEVAKQTHELREQAERLREADEQKTRFFQNVSHELRTPLTLILSPLEQLAASSELADDSRVELAGRNARRLLRLVNQLLDFQKRAAGKNELDLHPIDLPRFLRDCAEYVIPTCEQRGIRFVCELSEAQPTTVRSEADALEKIVFNYLSNALKYTPRDGTITLRLERFEDRGVARITVEDDGPGIAEEHQAQLFQVFSQVSSEAAPAIDGTGLGLALVKELTEACGGEVGVDSAKGEGSRFWAELPLAAAEAQSVSSQRPVDGEGFDAPRRRPITAELAADGPHEGKLVLVVDDLPDMRALIRQVLTRHGYRTIAAENGDHALRTAREHMPELIISDWMMPGMTGPELIEHIRDDEDLATIPVVLLTARGDNESRIHGARVGADGFLGKPFNEAELLSVARNLLQLKSKEREIIELNEDLRAERDLLASTQRQKDELTRFVVHDLKNPLTVILANLELLADDPSLSLETQVSLASSLVATENANRMVFALLDIARSEDGALKPQRRKVTIIELFEEVRAGMGRFLQSSGHDLELEHGDVAAALDRDLIGRVLENLVDNAAKYSAPGKPIELRAERQDRGVVLRVCDYGKRIPLEGREAIFDKYHRLARDSHNQTRVSRGLGLVFCRYAVEAHGGRIWVEDHPSGGNAFCIQLPDVADTSEQVAASA